MSVVTRPNICHEIFCALMKHWSYQEWIVCFHWKWMALIKTSQIYFQFCMNILFGFWKRLCCISLCLSLSLLQLFYPNKDKKCPPKWLKIGKSFRCLSSNQIHLKPLHIYLILIPCAQEFKKVYQTDRWFMPIVCLDSACKRRPDKVKYLPCLLDLVPLLLNCSYCVNWVIIPLTW